METAIWTLVGIAVTFGISHLYYRMGSSKSLGFFLLVDDQPLSRVDADVRERLVVQFFVPEAPEGVPGHEREYAAAERRNAIVVGTLHHVQIVVANTGIKAISFNEAPTFDIPANSLILDASIIYKKPQDMTASIVRLPVAQGDMQVVQLAIKMLNRGEFVLVKLLLSEAVPREVLRLHLLAEDLPRTLTATPMPAQSTKSRIESIEWPAVVVGFICAVGAGFTYILAAAFLAEHPLPALFSKDPAAFFGAITSRHFAAGYCLVFAIVMGFFSTAILFGVGLTPGMKSRRFVLPSELRPGFVGKAKNDGRNRGQVHFSGMP